MAAPIDPRLLRRARATRGYLVAGVLVGTLTAVLVIIQARVLTDQVAAIVDHRTLAGLPTSLAVLSAVVAGRAVLRGLIPWLGQRAAAAVKGQLRRDVLAARLRRPVDPVDDSGSLVNLATHGLDALDGYYSKYLPQLLLAATVPLVVGLVILRADLVSAITIAVTIPLIPLFMVLIGWVTEQRMQRRWGVQARLAHHFADLVAGLPTLQVFGRARAQEVGLRRIEERHRTETMGTLKVAFVSSGVLELLATLSVAIVAVSIGLRTVNGQMDLATGLFILVLAPEVYLPLRQVGTHYHDSAEGIAAANQAFAAIDAASTPAGAVTIEDAPLPSPRRATLRVRDLAVAYPGATSPAVSGVGFDVAPGEVVALSGPSGGGKSTVLSVLLGFVAPSAGQVQVGEVLLAAPEEPDDPGRLRPVLATPAGAAAWRRHLAWVGQRPGMVAGTVADNIALGLSAEASGESGRARLRAALDRAGGVGLDLDHPVGDDAEGLSAGEARRVGMARALRRTEDGEVGLLLLDEPTAGLDADTEALVIDALRTAGVGVVVVSHRPAVLAACDRVVRIDTPARDGDPGADALAHDLAEARP